MNFKGVLLLRRDGFDFYEDKSGRILSFPFSNSVVNSLEIINPGEFKNQIKAFIETNKFLPADLMIILSADVLFEKDIQAQDPNVQSQETSEFLDIIPFESISTKLLPIGQGVRAIAVNKNLIDTLSSSLKELGFLIGGIVPYEAVEGFEGIYSLNKEISKFIIKQFDSLKNASFEFENERKSIPQTESHTGKSNETSRLKFYAMLGVFGILLLILISLIIIRV
ncbi:MAG: hypothetical protein A2868_00110 [Candidatus Levybacteria bacterium RIFCSPHIGHO2_01_FULL_40_15b]|nr:MAG: hypothetical protein A2868_00110 [Candidatus Levybacteria bacterium RIFCSPHIGHO2_01_FULL_40_15b]